MPSIDEIYGSDETLKAHHLPPGASVPVTIERVTPKSFDDGGKLELKFAGKQRVLLCNKTNAGLIAKYLGARDYSQWTGRVVFLKPSETEFRGDIVPCIRVDLHPPANAAAQQQHARAPTPLPPAAAGEVTYVPDNPSDPGGYRAEAAAMAADPSDHIPF